MGTPLEKEFEYYLANQAQLVRQFDGKVIVIKGGMVLGAYDTELEAIRKTTEQHELGTFLVQKCRPGEQSYTQTYQSRVLFACK
jgi:hypothetical protein